MLIPAGRSLPTPPVFGPRGPEGRPRRPHEPRRCVRGGAGARGGGAAWVLKGARSCLWTCHHATDAGLSRRSLEGPRTPYAEARAASAGSQAGSWSAGEVQRCTNTFAIPRCFHKNASGLRKTWFAKEHTFGANSDFAKIGPDGQY